ncbi:MAG: diguanylate cyclase [Armatimonadetes bacterium]|nr:diguanylate cyclase [Armatimonadota bacterium]
MTIGEGESLGRLILGFEEPDPPRALSRLVETLQRALPDVVREIRPVLVMRRLVEIHRQFSSASALLQSSRSVDTVCDIINGVLRDGFGFDVALLALVEGGIHILRGHSVMPPGSADLSQLDFPLRTSNHPLATIAGKGTPVHALRCEAGDPRLAPLGLRGTAHQATWLPLIAKGEPVGLIIAFNTISRGELCHGTRSLLQLFANHAALAVSNMLSAVEIAGDAVRDALTGLYNRRFLDRALEQEVRRFKRYGTAPALLMIDLNDFKSFNDTHGHLLGDEILKETATLILDNVRETDVVARYGGDEFVVLMPNANETQARQATKRILSAVIARNRLLRDRPEMQFTLTVGHHVARGETAERILEAADRVMYERKDDGSRRRLLDQLVAPGGRPMSQHARLIFGLMKTLALKDPVHVTHARRVMGYSLMICEALELNQIETEQVATAAILHDIGKVVINAEILRRPGPLTDAEHILVRSHPVVAADMLAEISFLEHPLRLIRHHHERWDGRKTGPYPGYPDGLAGETIPLGSRIIRIADLFDSLTTDRPWRAALQVQLAVEVLRQESGRSLDPNITAKCLPLFEKMERPLHPDEIKEMTDL